VAIISDRNPAECVSQVLLLQKESLIKGGMVAKQSLGTGALACAVGGRSHSRRLVCHKIRRTALPDRESDHCYSSLCSLQADFHDEHDQDAGKCYWGRVTKYKVRLI
jgi:hypothetical protein